MGWGLLLNRWLWIGIAFAALAAYGAVQHTRLLNCQATFAKFQADTAKAGEEAKVKAAQERARMAQDAQEALDGLQVRISRLNGAYERLRNANPGSGGVPNLASAAPSLSACAGQPDKPDTTARFLAEVESRIDAVLQAGDAEIAKYVELWKLEQANAHR